MRPPLQNFKKFIWNERRSLSTPVCVKDAAAKELREELETEAKSVSSGSVVGHLAKMNRKSESEAKTDDSATEEKAAPDEATEPEE